MNMERFKRVAHHKRTSLERLINAIEEFGARHWQWLLPLALVIFAALLTLL